MQNDKTEIQKLKFARSAGMLISVSSFPSPFGIGCFTSDVDLFIDMAVDMGFRWWQLLPITSIGCGNSPYSGLSSYAGNYLYISPAELYNKGLITESELQSARYNGEPYLVDYDFAKQNVLRLLRLAFSRIDNGMCKKIERFRETESYWLDDYALFMALSRDRGTKWWEWESGLADRDAEALNDARQRYKDEIDFYVFEQYEFYSEWFTIKKRANERGIHIIGDLPFYVVADSVDVWANSDDFLLDENHRQTSVAGVPPDGFSSTGQVWGNCLYDFEHMKKDDYKWWRARVSHCLKLYDALRLDHFRAFHSYFSIPAGDGDASRGEWVKGPGCEIPNWFYLDNPNSLLIAEDLGDIDRDCRDFIKSTNIPTMRVFQFGFDGTDSEHLPHYYESDNVAYTGTHDNNTTLGWLFDLNQHARDYALKYCGYEGNAWAAGGPSCASVKAIIKKVISSSAVLAIIPVQDMLGYGVDTRMNVPGVAQGNWRFRLPFESMMTADRDFFLDINNTYGRNREGIEKV